MRAILYGAMLLSSTVAIAGEKTAPPSGGNPAPPGFEQQGEASWYSGRRQPRQADDNAVPTAAHPSLPKGSRVEVTNLKNDKSTEVEVNDRGPSEPGRVIDLSEEAAKRLDMKRDGLAPVRIETPPDEGKAK